MLKALLPEMQTLHDFQGTSNMTGGGRGGHSNESLIVPAVIA